MIFLPSAGPQHDLPRPRQGAATVEMAMIAPMIVLFLLGTFEMSRGFLVKEVLHDAARKACRTGILPGRGNDAVTADVNDVLRDNNISPTGATVTILVNGIAGDALTAKRGDKVSVQVSIPVSQVNWTTTIFLQTTMIESGTVAMMKQG